jgi:hypothetical protein
MTTHRDIAIKAVDQAYSDGVRNLFSVLRLEFTTSHGNLDACVVAFSQGLANLGLVRQAALQAIEDSETMT